MKRGVNRRHREESHIVHRQQVSLPASNIGKQESRGVDDIYALDAPRNHRRHQLLE
jgi:hypothetical protein